MSKDRQFGRKATAAMLAGLCACGTSGQMGSGGSLDAAPMSGTAPLVVTFRGRGSGELEGVMLLDFGDGQTDASISTVRDFTRTHTYEAAGSYVATLKAGAYGGRTPATLSAVARVTITVR